MSEIHLPKDYLSYSALSLWKRDPDGYRKRYYEGEPYFSTPYTEFGNKVGGELEAMAKGEIDDYFDPILHKVPYYSNPEQKIEVDIAGVPFLMYLDSFDPDSLEILEYKTGIVGPGGREPWGRVQVRKHTQLPIYTLGVKLKYGSYNPKIKLVWMETKWSTVDHELKFQDKVISERRPGLKLTGRVETFEREIADWELDRMENIIRKAAEEISEDYIQWKKKKTHKEGLSQLSDNITKRLAVREVERQFQNTDLPTCQLSAKKVENKDD